MIFPSRYPVVPNCAGGRLRRRLLRLGASAAVAMLAGCVGTVTYDVESRGFNRELRRDRGPLTPEQWPPLWQAFPEIIDGPAAFQKRDARRYGPYRFAADDLVTTLVPAEVPLTRLPQSDCWWMAQSPNGGGDAVLATWEGEFELIPRGNGALRFQDSSDGRLDIGMCRLNDPQSRQRVEGIGVDPDGGDEVEVRVACDDVSNVRFDGFAWTQNEHRNGPTCLSDSQWVSTNLFAYRNDNPDAMNRCEAIRSGFDSPDRQIEPGVDFYDHLAATNGSIWLLSSCTRAGGQRLVPAKATQYVLTNFDTRFREAEGVRLEPVLLPVQAGTTLSRELTVRDGLARWSTPWSQPQDSSPVTPLPGNPLRWVENFSRNIAVHRVRLFNLVNGRRQYVLHGSGAPALCITDPDVAPGVCRWTCNATADESGRLQYRLLDGNSCRVGQGPGQPIRLTPTYAHDRELAVAEGNGTEFHLPLVWSIQQSQPGTWIDFELTTVLQPAVMRAAPLMDAGAARTGEFARGSYTVVNEGEHPLRILGVAMDPAQGGHPGDFSVQLPFAPSGAPLPIEFTGTGKNRVLTVGADAEQRTLFKVFTDDDFLSIAPRQDGFVANVNGIRISDDHGLLLRDRASMMFNVDPTRQPAVRATYAQRSVPFSLMPGESFDVSVRARPSAVGERYGFVRVSAVSAIDPTRRLDVRTRVSAQGLSGPLINASPGVLAFVVDGSGVGSRRTAMIQNAGDSAGTIGAPELRLIDDSPLPAGSQLSLEHPGQGGGPLAVQDARTVRVLFASDCSRGVVDGYRDEAAKLAWATPDGDVWIPVHASTRCIP